MCPAVEVCAFCQFYNSLNSTIPFSS